MSCQSAPAPYSGPPISAHQCHPSVPPVSAISQC
ncbi:unnamed protein product, partial [Staurois parvus]